MAENKGRSEQNEDRRPLFMISIAAELAEMHPQTLRMYERRGLIRPHRSSKQTRLYSMSDVEKLRYIQQLTSEFGLNLAGVEKVLELEQDLAESRARIMELERRLEVAVKQAQEEIEAIRRSYRKELVPVQRSGQVVVCRVVRQGERGRES